MGQAKQRGTFEQRKVQAITAGRVKVRYSKSAMEREARLVIQNYFSKMTRFSDLMYHR